MTRRPTYSFLPQEYKNAQMRRSADCRKLQNPKQEQYESGVKNGMGTKRSDSTTHKRMSLNPSVYRACTQDKCGGFLMKVVICGFWIKM